MKTWIVQIKEDNGDWITVGDYRAVNALAAIRNVTLKAKSYPNVTEVRAILNR